MIHIIDKISSTNFWLSRYCKEVGDMVLAREQINGRGRLGNSWESNAGGLYFSIISENHKLLPFIAGICVISSLDSSVKNLQLKWPNDIILNGKKLGGILCENLGNYSIIGIGLNINNELSISNSVSLSSLEIEFDNLSFISLFLANFHITFNDSSEAIIQNFKNNDCLQGKEIFWNEYSGIVKSIEADGSLLVQTSKKFINLYSNEVHLEKYQN